MQTVSHGNIKALSCAVFLLLFLSGWQHTASSQIKREAGVLPVYGYAPKEYKETPQNWSITEDSRGVKYIANNGGQVLEFDGKEWRSLLLPKKPTVRAVFASKGGKIYVGAYREFGYLSPDTSGRMIYRSLLKNLQTKDRDFNDIWNIIRYGNEMYFQARERIFIWDGQNMRSWNSQYQIHALFAAGDQLYVYQKGFGLCRFRDGRAMLIKGGEAFENTAIAGIISFAPDTELIVTYQKGLYLMISHAGNADGIIKPFETACDPYYNRLRISCALLLPDASIALGTFSRGLIILDHRGGLKRVIDKSGGLPDETVNNVFLDSHNNLWLALSNGLARINISSPITWFDDMNGLEGTVETIARYRGKLYVGTHSGLYNLKPAGKPKDLNELSPEFIKIRDIEQECWDILPFSTGEDSLLLLGLNFGVYQLNANGKITEALPRGKYFPWILHPSAKQPARVFIGHDNGIASMLWNGKKWIDEGPVGDIDVAVRSIAEDEDGNLFLGTINNGIIELRHFVYNASGKIDSVETVYYNQENGLPDEGYYFAVISRRWNVYGTEAGLYRFDRKKGRFYPDPAFSHGGTDERKAIHIASEDKTGNLWMVTIRNREIEIGIASRTKQGGIKWYCTPFREISNDIVHTIFHDNNGITWLGGAGGLFRYDSRVPMDYEQPYYALVRKIKLGQDSVIFYGNHMDTTGGVIPYQPLNPACQFAYRNNSIVFEYAAPVYAEKGSNRYSYFLEGFDRNWSPWTKENKAVYTNLHEGDYAFHVKAMNNFQHQSEEAVYRFSILPPWYRTWWAYIIYVLAFVSFVWGAVRVSTRGLQRIIKERTAEVVRQKEVIEEKNKDIMDSIRYAKRIQQAILPPSDMLQRALKDYFILYKPKDIVSGDFYWSEQIKDTVLFAVVDCTGHGVPGAFMSIMGYNGLNQAINEHKLNEPAKVLDHLNVMVHQSLRQQSEGSASIKDGMDIALCSINFRTGQLMFAGANNPLYLVRDGKVIQIKGDKRPIGAYVGHDYAPFVNHEMQIQSGDIIYIFSDGYVDQFGGPEDKKFKYRPFRKLLVSIHEQPMDKQKEILDNSIEAWRGDAEQNDDICIFGVRIGSA